MWPLNAQLAIEVFGYGGFIPAAVSLAMVLAVRRILPNSASKRYAAALGLGTAFFVGYALLPEQMHASLRPQRYWHWLPYLGAVAMMAGPVGLAHGLLAMERWLMQLMLALLAACLLVPTWESLQPPRTVCIPLLTSYFFVLMTALAPLPARVSARLFQSLLAVVALCVAGMIWALVSETTGRVAAVVAAGMMGVCVSSFFSTAHDTLVMIGIVVPRAKHPENLKDTLLPAKWAARMAANFSRSLRDYPPFQEFFGVTE